MMRYFQATNKQCDDFKIVVERFSCAFLHFHNIIYLPLQSFTAPLKRKETPPAHFHNNISATSLLPELEDTKITSISTRA
jgi:hypothetical protein